MISKVTARAAMAATVVALFPLAVFTAPPSAAVSSCITSISPKAPVSYSALKVACVFDISPVPTLNSNGLEIHDALNAAWHRGAARTAAVGVTLNSTTITYASGVVTATDIRRPISGPGIPGGAFIVTAGVTSGTMSMKATATSAATAPKTIAHTSARVLQDAKYAVGGATSTLISATAAFTGTDVNKSVRGGGFAIGARISAVTNATTIVVTPGTTARAGQVLAGNGTHTSGTKNVTGWTGAALVDASDIGATVAGTGIAPGTTITAVVSATAFTLSANATSTGATALTITEPLDVITIGATQYTAASPSTAQTYTETFHRQLTKTSGVTCATNVLTSTPAGGGFRATDIGLKVVFLNSGATVAGTWRVSASPAPTPTTARLSANCPATWTHLVVGEADVTAPLNGDVMTGLSASMNLNPAIVPSVDNCNKNTYEGFQLIGRWQNPGGYASGGLIIGAPVANSIAQIVFTTSIVSFAGYVVPMATDAAQAGPHYDFIFPSLPTSTFSVTCPLSPTVTTNRTGFALGFSAVVAPPATNAAVGGNPSSPNVRAIGPQTGLFAQKVVLKYNTTVLATLTPAGCTIVAATAVPDYSCGSG